MRSLVVVLISLLATKAQAFPEMVRHGYIHCNSCHTSLVGGNLLNDYGRSLSRELLSQLKLAGKPSQEGDEKFFYGLADPGERWLLGGDIRLLQLFSESKQASRGRFLIMQVDVDAFFHVSQNWGAFFSVGRIEPKNSDPTAKDFVSSPRHGLEYVFSEPEAVNRWAVRAGRFMPAYGIAFAEHTLVTRRFLDLMPGQERYAAEMAWNNDRASVIGTAILSQASGNQLKEEKGAALQAAMQVGEGSKVGVSWYQTQREDQTQSFARRMHGVFAHLGFNKQWYGLFEVDRTQGQDQKWGMVEVFKLGYEVIQGWHLIGIHEFANLNMDKSNPKFEAYSLGTEWFPRPHWDLYGLLRAERDTAVGNDFGRVVWLVGHFYF